MKSIMSDVEAQVSLRLQLEKNREAVSGAPIASPPNAHSFRYTVLCSRIGRCSIRRQKQHIASVPVSANS